MFCPRGSEYPVSIGWLYENRISVMLSWPRDVSGESPWLPRKATLAFYEAGIAIYGDEYSNVLFIKVPITYLIKVFFIKQTFLFIETIAMKYKRK